MVSKDSVPRVKVSSLTLGSAVNTESDFLSVISHPLRTWISNDGVSVRETCGLVRVTFVTRGSRHKLFET